ncbi:MAG TPA: hypothetical protein VHC90_19525 [Bryobacteraceae bacterium]|nr:hypothetical protein [Bryobacteraceae bacterium]
MTKVRVISSIAFAFAASPLLVYSQTAAPAVTAVVNSASYSAPVEPGSLITIFGANLAAGGQSAAAGETPLPTNIAGTSAAVNGVALPLLYVSSTQINAQLPWTGPGFGGPTTLTLTAPGGSTSFVFQSQYLAPGLFTSDSSGCGQAAALNVQPDGTVSINSPENSAAPGDYLVLFGSGIGDIAANQPANGAPNPAQEFSSPLGVELDAIATQAYFGNTAELTGALAPGYAGLAPALIGSGQVNVRIPETTREGCAVPVMLESFPYLSQTVTVSVHSGRGSCTDPVTASYGQIDLVNTIASGTANDGETETISAQFPSAPGLVQPPVTAYPASEAFNFPADPQASARSCAIPGYSRLSAGPITIDAGPGRNIIVPPAAQTDGVIYQTNLPAGTIAPGQLSISSSGPVTFQDSLVIGSPIVVQTNLSPGTVLSAATAPTIQWTGGDANSVVRLSLVSNTPDLSLQSQTYYAPANAHSITLQTFCSERVIQPPAGYQCSFLIPAGSAHITLDVLPTATAADSIPAQGLTQKLNLSWSYRYVFDSLTLANCSDSACSSN